jgi:Uma2 family endonuclease
MPEAGDLDTLYSAIERLPVEVVPDWICEVLSPSTAGTDRESKMPV